MSDQRTIDKLFVLFLSLPISGVVVFILANTAGLRPALAVGSAVLVAWLGSVAYTMFRGGVFSGFPIWFVALFALFSCWIFWITSLPPYFRDDLIIHLEFPKTILRAGSWVFIPFQPSSVFPNALLPMNVVLVNAGLDRAVSAIPALYYLATALVLAAWAGSEYGAGWGVFSAAALVLEPVFFRLSTTAYNDPVVMFFSCVGTFYFWRYFKDGRAWDGYRGGLSFAAGSAIKYNAGLLLVVILGALFADSIRRGLLRERFKVFVVSVVAVLCFCGPWWVRFADVHPSSPGSGLTFNGPMHERAVLCRESFPMAMASPVRLFFEGEEGNRCAYDGRLSPFMLLLGVFCLPLAGASADKKFLLVCAGFFMVVASLKFPITARYYLPVAPTLIFLSAGFLFFVEKWRKPAAIGLAVAMLVFSAQGYARAAYKFDGWGYLLGRETADQFLGKSIAGYKATMFANRTLGRDSLLYFIFFGNQVYYSSVPYYYDSFWDGMTFIRLFKPETANDEVLRQLRSKNITHIVYNKRIMGKLLTESGQIEKFMAFRETQARLIYSDDEAELLELARQKP